MPDFFIIWSIGPSCLIGPVIIFSENNFINGPPIKKTIFTYKHINKEKRGNILQSIEDIDLSLRRMISNNDYLMIKGSNATGLYDFSKKMIKGI